MGLKYNVKRNRIANGNIHPRIHLSLCDTFYLNTLVSFYASKQDAIAPLLVYSNSLRRLHRRLLVLLQQQTGKCLVIACYTFLHHFAHRLLKHYLARRFRCYRCGTASGSNGLLWNLPVRWWMTSQEKQEKLEGVNGGGARGRFQCFVALSLEANFARMARRKTIMGVLLRKTENSCSLHRKTAATDLASRIANRVVPSDRRGLSDGDAGEVAEDEDEAAFANATPEEVISSNVNLLLRVLLWLSSKGVPRLPLARRQPGDAAAGEVAKWGEEGPRSPLALSEGDDGGKSTGGGSGRIFGGEKSILGQSLTLPRARCSGRSSGATLLLLLLLEPRLLSLM